MPPYSWLHLENVWWLLGGGCLFAFAIILARASTTLSFSFLKRSDQEIKEEIHEFAGEVKERNGPVPIFIWLVGLAVLVWAIAYTVFSGKHGL